MSRALRVTALVSTLLMALANLPTAFAASDEDVPAWLQWPATVVGVIGVVTFIALLKRVSWSLPAVLVVGLLNVVTAVAVLADGNGSGALGLVLGGIAVLSAGARTTRPVAVDAA